VDLPGPSLRAEGFAARVVRELSLGVGDRILATVLSDLGDGRFEVRLGDRILKVQSPQPLEVGGSLALAVRQAGSRLLLEILEHRPQAPALSGLALPDDAAHRDALGLLAQEGLPLTRAAVEAVASAGSPLARRAAAFLMASGLEPSRELVDALAGAIRGGALAEAVRLLEAMELPLAREILALLTEGSFSSPGLEALSKARVALESGLFRLLAEDPRLAALDRAHERLGDAPAAPPTPRCEASAKALLGTRGDPEATRLLEGMEEALRREVAGQIARWEGEALSSLPWLGRLREAHRALTRAMAEEPGRLLLGREGIRYAEGVFRPPGEGAVPVRLKVSAREGGRDGGEGRKGPLRVAVSLSFSALGGVGAELAAEGRRLRTTLQAERAQAEALLRERSPELAQSLGALGFEAEVAVSRPKSGAQLAGFFEALSVAGVLPPLVDFKV